MSPFLPRLLSQPKFSSGQSWLNFSFQTNSIPFWNRYVVASINSYAETLISLCWQKHPTYCLFGGIFVAAFNAFFPVSKVFQKTMFKPIKSFILYWLWYYVFLQFKINLKFPVVCLLFRNWQCFFEGAQGLRPA